MQIASDVCTGHGGPAAGEKRLEISLGATRTVCLRITRHQRARLRIRAESGGMMTRSSTPGLARRL